MSEHEQQMREQIEELKDQVRQLSDRENSHYTDIMLLLKQIDTTIEAELANTESKLSFDELYEDAREMVMEAGKASTSYLQRVLNVGYSRATKLMDKLEEEGIVGPEDGAKPREVLKGK